MAVTQAPVADWDVQTEAFHDLCSRFDRILFDETQADAAAVADLTTFARLFDLTVDDCPPAQLWRRLRPLIAREISALTGSPGAPVPSEFQAKIVIPSRLSANDTGAEHALPKLLLLAEDDPDVAAEMVEILTEAGHTVIGPATTAAQAATLAMQHPIDLALVDVGLAGDVDGAQLAAQLRSSWGVHCLLLSASADNRRHLDSDAVVGFVGKPFRSAELLAAIELASALVRH